MLGRRTKSYCKEDISLIENYDKAINDKEHIWDCHHKLEIGEGYTNSTEDLKMMNLYFNRPANELIFLTKKEHARLHLSCKESQAKATKSRIGLKRSDKFKKEQSIRLKGNHKGQHWRVINGKRCWYTNELAED